MIDLAFDDLTMAEVDLLQREALDGVRISAEDGDPLKVAAGIMWIATRRDKPEMTWPEFSETLTMREVKAYGERIGADAVDPTNGP